MILVLCALPVLADEERAMYVQAEVVALRETLWTLSEAADRGDVLAAKALVDITWKQWLNIDCDLRSEIKYAYPLIERQMDHLESEAIGRATQFSQVPNPPAVDMPTPVRVRYPGYSDPYDLFGNSGLGKL